MNKENYNTSLKQLIIDIPLFWKLCINEIYAQDRNSFLMWLEGIEFQLNNFINETKYYEQERK